MDNNLHRCRMKREETTQKSMHDFFQAKPQKASTSKISEIFDEDNLSDAIDVSSDEDHNLRIDCDVSSPDDTAAEGSYSVPYATNGNGINGNEEEELRRLYDQKTLDTDFETKNERKEVSLHKVDDDVKNSTNSDTLTLDTIELDNEVEAGKDNNGSAANISPDQTTGNGSVDPAAGSGQMKGAEVYIVPKNLDLIPRHLSLCPKTK